MYLNMYCIIYVSNHKPRKGTETLNSLFHKRFGILVSNHKPRKGTETGSISPMMLMQPPCFKSQTPQGDGNAVKRNVFVA